MASKANAINGSASELNPSTNPAVVNGATQPESIESVLAKASAMAKQVADTPVVATGNITAMDKWVLAAIGQLRAANKPYYSKKFQKEMPADKGIRAAWGNPLLGGKSFNQAFILKFGQDPIEYTKGMDARGLITATQYGVLYLRGEAPPTASKKEARRQAAEAGFNNALAAIDAAAGKL